jgi:uncharacterized protein YozE (UPF0346 family)
MKFYAWLMKNRWRADPIGDFARDVHRDASWPKKANTWIDVQKALPATACDGARSAMRDAWNEYELYVGGPSHLDKDVWVWGVTGVFGLELPKGE